MSRCPAVQEQLPELALGVLDGAERATVLDHLEHCGRCRVVAEGHAATADALALLAPEAEPPPGFALRTQARLRSARGDRSRWPRRQRVYALAAAAAFLVIATLATVRIVDASRSTTATATAGRVHDAAMIGAGGVTVGRVYATESRGDDFLFVTVEYGMPNGSYSVDVAGERGLLRVGTMTVTGGRGEWAGPSGGTAGPPAEVRLVDASGATICHASFSA